MLAWKARATNNAQVAQSVILTDAVPYYCATGSGADQILSGKGGLYTDEDIDALIAKGEERTEEMQAKLQTDAKHNC